MNVYDFDKTIYAGDSTLDFYFFCIKKHPLLLRFFPKQLTGLILYKFKKLDKTGFKEYFYTFLPHLPDIDYVLKLFWEQHAGKIQPWYFAQKKAQDVIISASPEFLLRPACARLGIKTLIASRVNPKTGKYTGTNCYGEEKVRRFYANFPDGGMEEFYSDSLSDLPLAKLAQKAFLIRGENRTEYPA